MNYNKLKYFYEIAKIQSVSKAATQLYVSQSSLSKTIYDLEIDFGNKLFFRKNRKITLTPAGKELFKNIEKFFSQEQDLYNKIRSIENSNMVEIISEIKVGYMPTEIGLGIHEFKKIFQEKYPQTKILAKRLNKFTLNNSLKNNEVDLVCATIGEEDLTSNMEFETIVNSFSVVVLNKSHPLSKKNKISFNDLKNEKFILMGHDKSSLQYVDLLGWFKRFDFKPDIVNVFDYVEVVLLQVQNSNYLTILSEHSPFRRFKDLVAVPIESPFVLSDGFMWCKKNSNKHISLFVKEYKKWYLKTHTSAI